MKLGAFPAGSFDKGQGAGTGVWGGYYGVVQGNAIALARASDGAFQLVAPDNSNRSFSMIGYASPNEVWVVESDKQPAEHQGIAFERIGLTWP